LIFSVKNNICFVKNHFVYYLYHNYNTSLTKAQNYEANQKNGYPPGNEPDYLQNPINYEKTKRKYF